MITRLKELEGLSNQWNSLLKKTASDNIFLTWEWHYTWAKYYLAGDMLWVILVYRENAQLAGIAPLYIRRIKRYGLLTLREIKFLGTEGVCSSYLDFIISERDKKTVICCIYRYLYEDAKGLWDILTLSEIPAGSSSIDIMDDLIQEAGKVMEIISVTSCPVIRLTGRLEDFMAEISRNERYNLQRKCRHLEKKGNVEYYRVSSPKDIEKEMDVFIQLHQMRWEQKGTGGVFQNQRFLMFHQEISRIFSHKGWVHLDFLLLNDEKIAGIYGYIYNNRYYFYLPGFNPIILPQASPGRLLLFHCIKEAIMEGCEEFDLLRGTADYKMAWANGIQHSLTLRHYNRHLRTAAFKLLESGKDIIKVIVR